MNHDQGSMHMGHLDIDSFAGYFEEITMKRRILSCSALVAALALASCQMNDAAAPGLSDPGIPHLQKHGTATQLIVDGKPFLALTGELSNSSATSLEYMKGVWPRIAPNNLNLVLAGVSWNQIEPQEGKFDFSVLDGVIEGARKNHMRLGLLWFGTWKNSMSCYPPDWVKKDYERFPRAWGKDNTAIELITPLSDTARDADARAFAALMRHVKQVDSRQHTVIMIQVENEVGTHYDTVDRSPMAKKVYAGPVPKELMDYLQQHKDTLIPEFKKNWEAAGLKTAGTWEEVFGKGTGTEGIFMSWYYARFIDGVAKAGKAEYPLPMYVNAALYGIPKQPEFTPSLGRPYDLVMDVWRAGGPRIDWLSPDIYSTGDFAGFCAKYTQSGNPLFIPETGGDMEAKTLYVFGRYDAIGISLFGVDRSGAPNPDMAGGFQIISQLAPLIAQHQGDGSMTAILFGANDPAQKVRLGNYTFELARSRPRIPAATQPGAAAQGGLAGALIIQTGPDEFYAAGNNITVTPTVTPGTPGPEHAGIGTIEEGTFENGRWIPIRQLSGDEAGGGDYVNLRTRPTDRIAADHYVGIQRFTTYRYR